MSKIELIENVDFSSLKLEETSEYINSVLDPETILLISSLKEKLKNLILSVLNENEARVIELRYLGEKIRPIEEIHQITGISKS